MASYKLVIKKSVAKDLRNIPNKNIKQILKCFDALIENPRVDGCIKLSVQERYRVRQGLYKFIYEIQDLELIIVIVNVAHRSEAYKSS